MWIQPRHARGGRRAGRGAAPAAVARQPSGEQAHGEATRGIDRERGERKGGDDWHAEPAGHRAAELPAQHCAEPAADKDVQCGDERSKGGHCRCP